MKCNNCGETNHESDAVFCHNCGERLVSLNYLIPIMQRHWNEHLKFPGNTVCTLFDVDAGCQLISSCENQLMLNIALNHPVMDYENLCKFKETRFYNMFQNDNNIFELEFGGLTDDAIQITTELLTDVFGVSVHEEIELLEFTSMPRNDNAVDALPYIQELLSKGMKLDAVRYYCERYGVGLKEAKNAVDKIETQNERVRQEKERVEFEAKAKAEAEAEEQRIREEMEKRLLKEAEERLTAEFKAKAKAKAEEEARLKTEEEARLKAKAEAKAKAKAETKTKETSCGYNGNCTDEKMSFVDAIKNVFSHYADFSGRARRSEYWWFALLGLILGFIPYVNFIWMVVALVPGLAVAVRRLHDTGKSWKFLLIGLIPIIGAIILLYWYCQDSYAGANEYGPSPKKK